jgi:S1-C subfamily serine protease
VKQEYDILRIIPLGKSRIFIQITVFTLIPTILFCTLNNPSLAEGAQEFGYKSNVASLGNPNATSILTQLFSKVENSVVQVTASVNATDPFGSSLGSGFVYDKNGHIVTNYHVVGAAANQC